MGNWHLYQIRSIVKYRQNQNQIPHALGNNPHPYTLNYDNPSPNRACNLPKVDVYDTCKQRPTNKKPSYQCV